MLIFKKEKAVRKLVLEHLATVKDCLLETHGALEAYASDDFDGASKKAVQVNEIESKADGLERSIREALLGGAFLPQMRSDVYRLVESIDAIAGKAEDVAFFMHAQKPRIPDEYDEDLLKIFRKCLDCFAELHEALKNFFKPKGKLENVHEHVARVSEIETEVDALESAFAQRVFATERMDLSEKIHIEQLAKRIADLADLSEDAADELEFAAMKSVL